MNIIVNIINLYDIIDAPLNTKQYSLQPINNIVEY